MDLRPPIFPDDYLVDERPHAAALAAIELVGLMRNGSRLDNFTVEPRLLPGFRLALHTLVELVETDWRELRASDADYLLAGRAARAAHKLEAAEEAGDDLEPPA